MHTLHTCLYVKALHAATRVNCILSKEEKKWRLMKQCHPIETCSTSLLLEIKVLSDRCRLILVANFFYPHGISAAMNEVRWKNCIQSGSSRKVDVRSQGLKNTLEHIRGHGPTQLRSWISTWTKCVLLSGTHRTITIICFLVESAYWSILKKNSSGHNLRGGYTEHRNGNCTHPNQFPCQND